MWLRRASRLQRQKACAKNWAKLAITAEEEKGTSVLNVEFRDTDEQLVLPITEMISQAYQGYSNRGRARELSNLIAYLNEQINTIKPQAEASARAALDYGYANGLGLLDGLPLLAMLPVLVSPKMDPPKVPR